MAVRGAGVTRIVVHYFGADPAEFQAVSMPWEWRTFTVIDTGTGTLTYVPTVNIARLDVDGDPGARRSRAFD